MSEIPEIQIPEVPVPFVYTPYVPTNIRPPSVIPGCTYQHRDQHLNPNLLIDDPNGVFTTCPEGEIPHFWPMDYSPKDITVIKEGPPSEQKQPPLPESEQPEIPKLPEEKEDDVFIDCPGPRDQRIGDFRNDKKLEKVSGHKLSENGKECITLYEDVPFFQQFLPTPQAAVQTATIGLIAASSPLLLNLIKPAVQNLVKKLTGKKKEKKLGEHEE